MLIFWKKNLMLAKLRWSRCQKVYFLKLHMCLYIRTNFQVSSIILTSFRIANITPSPTTTTTAKRIPKKPTQIRFKAVTFSCIPKTSSKHGNIIVLVIFLNFMLFKILFILVFCFCILFHLFFAPF